MLACYLPALLLVLICGQSVVESQSVVRQKGSHSHPLPKKILRLLLSKHLNSLNPPLLQHGSRKPHAPPLSLNISICGQQEIID